MTFYHEKDLGKIIKEFNVDGYNYNIKYLDGTETNYYCTDELKINELEETMIKQAIRRDDYYYDLIQTEIKRSAAIINLLSASTILAVHSNAILIVCLNLVMLIAKLKKYIKDKSKLKELKKYRLFLNMYKELKKDENKNITDILQFDKIYQIPILDVNTIDDFSLKDVETINDELKKRKELKAN